MKKPNDIKEPKTPPSPSTSPSREQTVQNRLSSIWHSLNETVLFLLLLCTAFTIYFLLYALATSQYTLLKELFKTMLPGYLKLFVQYIEVFIIFVVSVFLKKFIVKRWYRLSGPESRRITLGVYAETLVEKFFLLATVLAVLFLSAIATQADPVQHLAYFENTANSLALMVLVLLVYALPGGIVNLVFIRSFVPASSSNGKITKLELKRAVFLSTLLPGLYLVAALVLPKGLKIFFNLARYYFGNP